MNSHNAITDKGNYAGIPSEYTSEAILAYVMGIEDRRSSVMWLSDGEEFGQMRELVKLDLGL